MAVPSLAQGAEIAVPTGADGKSTAAAAAGMKTTDPKAGGVAGTGLGGDGDATGLGTSGTGKSVKGPPGAALNNGMQAGAGPVTPVQSGVAPAPRPPGP